MRIKHILLVALACVLVSCGEKPTSPVEEAITKKVAEQLGDLDNMYFSSLALVDSTTFGEEVARRRNTLEARYKQNLKLARDYEAAGKLRNEAKKREDAANDQQRLEGLAALEQRLAENDSLNVVEVYIYKFSGKARNYKGTVTIDNMYVSITPDNEVVAMDYKKEGVLKSTGHLIPGYSSLFE